MCLHTARTNHHLSFYLEVHWERKSPLPHTWRPPLEIGQCVVYSLMLDLKYFMYLYTVMYLPIMIICKLKIHNLLNVVQHKNIITQKILYLGILAVSLQPCCVIDNLDKKQYCSKY